MSKPGKIQYNRVTPVERTDAVRSGYNLQTVKSNVGLIREQRLQENRMIQDYLQRHPEDRNLSRNQILLKVSIERQTNTRSSEIRLGKTSAERYGDRKSGSYATELDLKVALNLAEAHNASFLGGMVSPYITEEYARTHPREMTDVMMLDAFVLPSAMSTAVMFDSPSLISSTWLGVRNGWQTAGNVGTRLGLAVLQGASAAGEVATNPYFLTTAGTLATPIAADAMNEGTKDALMDVGLTIGVPLTMYGVGKGIGWIGNKFSSKAAQAVDGAIPTTYTANRKLFTWENPWGWVSTQGLAIEQQNAERVVNEWNALNKNDKKAVENFIKKYDIRDLYKGTLLKYNGDPVISNIARDLQRTLTGKPMINDWTKYPTSQGLVFTEPTTSQKWGAGIRNAGRVATWSTPFIFGAKAIYDYNKDGSSEDLPESGDLSDNQFGVKIKIDGQLRDTWVDKDGNYHVIENPGDTVAVEGLPQYNRK